MLFLGGAEPMNDNTKPPLVAGVTSVKFPLASYYYQKVSKSACVCARVPLVFFTPEWAVRLGMENNKLVFKTSSRLSSLLCLLWGCESFIQYKN